MKTETFDLKKIFTKKEYKLFNEIVFVNFAKKGLQNIDFGGTSYE